MGLLKDRHGINMKDYSCGSLIYEVAHLAPIGLLVGQILGRLGSTERAQKASQVSPTHHIFFGGIAAYKSAMQLFSGLSCRLIVPAFRTTGQRSCSHLPLTQGRDGKTLAGIGTGEVKSRSRRK
jgi:hypothetical protein